MLHPIISAVLLLQALSGSLDASFPGSSSENKQPLASIPELNLEHHIGKYQKAQRRLFLLDSDETLRNDHTSDLVTTRVNSILTELAKSSKNRVVILSARPVEHLQQVYGDLPGVHFAGEHGLVTYDNTSKEHRPAEGFPALDTLETICWEIVNNHRKPTENWNVYKNSVTLAIGYLGIYTNKKGDTRKDPDGGERCATIAALIRHRVANPRDATERKLFAPYQNFYVQSGFDVVNVNPPAANKGEAAKRFLNVNPKYDFVVSMGDSEPDEPMHEAVNKEKGLSVVVNSNENQKSCAIYKLDGMPAVRNFLEGLSESP